MNILYNGRVKILAVGACDEKAHSNIHYTFMNLMFIFLYTFFFINHKRQYGNEMYWYIILE